MAPGLEDGEIADEKGASDPEHAPAALPRRRRSARHSSGKNLSLWPLPGGQGNYVQTMWRMLTFVSEREPTLDDFIDWMTGTFEKVNSRKTAKGYIEMVRLAGLVEPREDRLVLTSDAASYLASSDQEELYRTMCENIAGLEETLDQTRQAPSTLPELTAFLNTLLGTQWTRTPRRGGGCAGWKVLGRSNETEIGTSPVSRMVQLARFRDLAGWPPTRAPLRNVGAVIERCGPAVLGRFPLGRVSRSPEERVRLG